MQPVIEPNEVLELTAKLERIVSADDSEFRKAQRERVSRILRRVLNDLDFSSSSMPDVMTSAPKVSKKPDRKEFERAGEHGMVWAKVRKSVGVEEQNLLILKFTGSEEASRRFLGGVKRTPLLKRKIAALDQIVADLKHQAGDIGEQMEINTVPRWADVCVPMPDGYRASYKWRQRAMLSAALTERLNAALDKLGGVLLGQYGE